LGLPINTGFDKITCPSCGYVNPIWNIACEKCYKKLAASGVSDFATNRIKRSRPGCVTAYAILMFLGAGLMAFSTMIISLVFLAGNNTVALKNQNLGLNNLGSIGTIGFVFIFGFIAILIVFYIIIGLGLWNLKNWARYLVIVLQGIGLLGNIISIFRSFIDSSNAQGNPIAAISGSLFSLVLGGIVIYWFGAHGEYFS
jgi:uncharacterized membrane protein (DUF2068 family)